MFCFVKKDPSVSTRGEEIRASREEGARVHVTGRIVAANNREGAATMRNNQGPTVVIARAIIRCVSGVGIPLRVGLL